MNTHFHHLSSRILLTLCGLLLSLSAQSGVVIEHWKTTRGSEVLFVKNHSLPIVDVSLNFIAGSARDTPALSGLAALTQSMMPLGAAGLSNEALNHQLADVGALLDSEFDADRSTFKLRTLSSRREKNQALQVLRQILQQPDFPIAMLEREKSRTIAGLKEAASQPETIASGALMRSIYGAHPYGLTGAGEIDTVNKLTRDDLQRFYQTHYSAESAVITLIGDLSLQDAQQLAETLSAGLPQSLPVPPIPKVIPPVTAHMQRLAHPASQAHILLGYSGVVRGDVDFFPLYVGNYILGGGGFVSRLTEEVREKRGLAYSVYSYFLPMAELGLFEVGLQTKKAQADTALGLVQSVIARFVAEGVSEAELVAAKANLIGGFPLRLDSNSKILDYLNVIGFYHLPFNYLDNYPQHIQAVTAAQIKEAFSRRLRLDAFSIVVVGGQ